MNILWVLLPVLAVHFARSRSKIHRSRNPGNFEQHYPNLYFSADDLHKLRAQASSSHAEIYQELAIHVRNLRSTNKYTPPASVTLFNSKWNEVYGNMLATLAVYCALTPGDHEALDLVELFMDRFTNYSTWLVTGKKNDEIPLAHSILGYATALDCLHNSFTRDARGRYVIKLLQSGDQLYVAADKMWWGRSYIHNHVATNYMALLTAAIVIKPYYPDRALAWQEKAVRALDATIEYLRLVVDGSFQEGVSYGSYTMRSLAQFMYVSERHFAHNYRENIWLRKHFEFLLYTIMPGFQLTVGFADSNLNWAYGPESHLEFLESYISNDGKAKWLRNEIRQHRKNRLGFIDRKSLLHNEYLFYNSSVESKRASQVKLHVFSDWGVITYGGGVTEPRMFLSFKCSHLHGRAINLLRPSLDAKTRSGFVPGHEQPDQGSFVFVTKDQPVITESRYAPKLTYLQNTLLFGPTDKGCTPPYIGQLGECHLWFNRKNVDRAWAARADLVGYSREDDIIFMSGEMTQVYEKQLGLSTVCRALVMPTSNVLVVVDIVRFRTESVTTHASAFFHNSDFVFNLDAYNGNKNRCAAVGRYKMRWEHLNARTVDANSRNNVQLHKQRFATNFVNITWQRSRKLFTSTVYVFHAPEYTLNELKLFGIKEIGLRINLKLNSVKYNIVLSTRHDNPRLRRKLLGSYGYGKLTVVSKDSVSSFHLGVNISARSGDFTTGSDDVGDVSRSYGDVTASDVITGSVVSHKTSKNLITWSCEDTCLLASMFIFAAMLLVCFKARVQFKMRAIVICVCLPWVVFGCIFIQTIRDKRIYASPLPPYVIPVLPAPRENVNLLNAVFITGLPLSGVDIAREMFTTNPDFITTGIPSASRFSEDNLDLREWTKREIVDKEFAEDLNSLIKTPTSVKSASDYIALVDPLDLSSQPGTFIQKSTGALAAISCKNPEWLFRTSFLFENYQMPLLYIVRDPRNWIENILGQPEDAKSFLNKIKRTLQQTSDNFPAEFQVLRELEFATLKSHVVLSFIWRAFALYALRIQTTLPLGRIKIVRFEDLITSSRETANDVYTFLEMPFPAAVEHRIMQVTETGLYKFERYGTIEPRLCKWGKILAKSQVAEIYEICKKVMKNIGYVE